MIVGALGDVVFSVSSRTLKTISNFVWSGSARYATHDLHAGNSISEYTGTDLAKITFDIQLLASLGVDPMSEIWRLFDLERQGVTLPLTIGNHGYGRYRWTILSHKTKAEHYDGHGNIISATLSICLKMIWKLDRMHINVPVNQAKDLSLPISTGIRRFRMIQFCMMGRHISARSISELITTPSRPIKETLLPRWRLT